MKFPKMWSQKVQMPRNSFRKIFSCAVLTLALSNSTPRVFAASEQESQATNAENAFKVVPFETLGIGNESGCTKRALFAINDDAEWRRVWGVHTQGIADAQTLPKIDFSRQSVLAILSGERRDGKSLQIAQIVKGAQETVVYFSTGDEKLWLGVPEETKNGENQKVQPYTFVAVDKINVPVRFLDVFGAQNGCSKCAG